MGTPLGPKYIPYTYADPLGDCVRVIRSNLGEPSGFSRFRV